MGNGAMHNIMPYIILIDGEMVIKNFQYNYYSKIDNYCIIQTMLLLFTHYTQFLRRKCINIGIDKDNIFVIFRTTFICNTTVLKLNE